MDAIIKKSSSISTETMPVLTENEKKKNKEFLKTEKELHKKETVKEKKNNNAIDQKIIEKEREKIELAERDKVLIKINEYLNSKRFGKKLIENGFSLPDRKALTLQQATVYQQGIKNFLASDSKKQFVENSFFNGIEAFSKFAFQFTQDMAFIEMSEKIRENKDIFMGDLEEISIEMDGSMLPGPKTRILTNLLGLYATIKTEEQKNELNKDIP